MKIFQTGHEELVHDIKYDFYGRNVATASSDHHIKVFDLDPDSSEWVINDSWKAHDSLVVRVCWAHPEFSSTKILASCSFDRTVKIWQEAPEELHGLGRRWVKLATLAVELYSPIYDVEFAPPHLGLKIACIGSDGIVRVYESIEPSDLLAWNLTAEIPLLTLQLPTKSLQSSFGIAWCPAKFAETEMLAVVALDQAFIYESSLVLNVDLTSPGPQDTRLGIEENPSRLNSADGSRPAYMKVGNLPEHGGLIRSISWAPSMGRTFHLLATGCKDGYVRIFKGTKTESKSIEFRQIAKLSDHRLEVWHVEWNSTGTVLSSSGGDGKVRLWKSTYLDEWQCMSEINTSNRSDKRATPEQELQRTNLDK